MERPEADCCGQVCRRSRLGEVIDWTSHLSFEVAGSCKPCRSTTAQGRSDPLPANSVWGRRTGRDSLSAAGGKGGFWVAGIHAQSNASCRTKPGHLDPLYPPHLGGLPQACRNRKKNNFLPIAGFNLV